MGCGSSKPEYTSNAMPAQPVQGNVPQGYAAPQQAPMYQQPPQQTGRKRNAAKNLGFLSMLAN
ncbi:hypothetical protein QM012_005577 [Aureobasidium pullulans]|uniref:Uncharacterized protein n=1 Tax=Aureobasidium pullulans TaxID=5580 RepID=A0ABR0T5B3_AURPU